jgi:opacity protein-like surface antigen
MTHFARRHLAGIAVLFLTLTATPRLTSAEWYADLYGGGAFTNNTTLTQMSTLGVTLTSDLKVDSSFTAGGRVGYWFESLPYIGIGLDVFYFQPDVPTQNATFTATGLGTASGQWFKTSVDVVGIGFDVLRLRVPLLKSDVYRHGRLQPYLTAGPALFITNLKDSGGTFAPSNQSKSDTSIGVKVGAGVSFNVTKLIALFGEYRFTHFKADGTFQDSAPPPSQENVKFGFDTHHVIGGISFRFN